jgi:hypothetical protein
MSEYLNQWTWKTSRSPEQLAEERKASIIDAKKTINLSIDKFTCDDCDRAPICTLAFDLYNTNGDCLYEK